MGQRVDLAGACPSALFDPPALVLRSTFLWPRRRQSPNAAHGQMNRPLLVAERATWDGLRALKQIENIIIRLSLGKSARKVSDAKRAAV